MCFFSEWLIFESDLLKLQMNHWHRSFLKKSKAICSLSLFCRKLTLALFYRATRAKSRAKERPWANRSRAKSERTNSQPGKNVTIKKKLRYLSTPPFLPVDILLLLFFLFTHTSFITFIFIILVHEITVLSLVRLKHIVITVLLKQDIYSM